MTDQDKWKVEQLLAKGGPHEWGYRDVCDGGFIPDDTPYHMADEILSLRAKLAAAEEESRSKSERVTGYVQMLEAREAKLAELREAARPFDEAWKVFPNHPQLGESNAFDAGLGACLVFNDFRRLAALVGEEGG